VLSHSLGLCDGVDTEGDEFRPFRTDVRVRGLQPYELALADPSEEAAIENEHDGAVFVDDIVKAHVSVVGRR
jgi:hypothetical protein